MSNITNVTVGLGEKEKERGGGKRDIYRYNVVNKKHYVAVPCHRSVIYNIVAERYIYVRLARVIVFTTISESLIRKYVI